MKAPETVTPKEEKECPHPLLQRQGRVMRIPIHHRHRHRRHNLHPFC